MKQSLHAFTGAAGLMVLLALLIVVNALSGSLRLRADLTAENLYTLSEGTRDLLQQLPREVTLKFYYSRHAEGFPPALQQYAQRITDLLQEYAAASKGRLALEVLDPKPDSTEEEWAQRYGVAGQAIDPMGQGPAVYLGLVAVAGAKTAVIPFFSPADEPQIEYLVTRLVSEAIATRKPKLGVLSSLPVMGVQPSYFSPESGVRPPWVFISELRNQYQVEQLPPTFTEVPQDVDALLVVHPKQLSESVYYALDQYLLRGGKLLVFTDPLCLAEQEFQQMNPSMMDMKSDFNRLTTAWGFTQETLRVVADDAAATRVRVRDGRTEQHAAWLTLRAQNLNRAEITTAQLETMMLPMAGYYTGAPAEGLTLAPLITSGAEAGSITSMEAGMGALGGMTSRDRFSEPRLLALRLSGTFKTAFPAGRPAADGQSATNPPPPGLQEATAEGVVVLVADVDMLYDEFAVQRLNGLGQTFYQLVNDNINFTANLAGQLLGGEQLISLRSRGVYERPFTRVLDLQKTAQERWRQEELKLQEQLRLTQLKLNELQSAKDPSQQYVITPEQKREIEQFREQQAQTRQQLKAVRKNLRQDIETLGLWIKGLNLAAVPLAVTAFGLIHGWRRRQRHVH